MAEADAQAVRRLFQQPRLACPLDHLIDGIVIDAAHRRPEFARHLLSDHRRLHQQLARPLAEARGPAFDHLREEAGDQHPAEIAELPAGLDGG